MNTSPSTPLPQYIEPTDIPTYLEKGSILIDVREKHEWDAGHIPQAVHIPLATLPEESKQLDLRASYIVICKSGGRSQKATDYLLANNFAASNILGGMLAYEEINQPIVDSEGNKGTVA